MHLAKLAGELRRRHAIADPPAGGMQRLAERKHRVAALAQLRVHQYGLMAPPIEEHMLIHLVGDHGDRPIADTFGEGVEIGARGDRAARILWAVDDDEAGAVAQGAADFVPIEAKCGGRERNAHAARAGEPHGRLVRVVGRIENNSLIARPRDRLNGVIQRLGATAGNRDLSLRIKTPLIAKLEFLCDLFAQLQRAFHRRILIAPLAHHLDQRGG